MAIIRKHEALPERPVIVLIYGTPGVGKTSVACTADKPLLLDCDHGGNRACYRADTVVANSWSEMLADQGQIMGYKTLVVDTAKSVLDDFIMMHVQQLDYKLRTNMIKAYGMVGDEFKKFVNTTLAGGTDMLIIAPAKEEKEGDITKVSPDVTGQSKDLLLRKADQVGFMSMVNGKRTITFEPTDRTTGKNVGQIPTLTVPDAKDPAYSTFCADIIGRVKDGLVKRGEHQLAFQMKLDTIMNNINTSFPKAIQEGLKKKLREKCNEMSIEFDKDAAASVETTTVEDSPEQQMV